MTDLIIDLDIPKDTLLHYYRGNVSSVLATAHGGQRVQFPLLSLRPFVNHYGIRGRFRLTIDGQHKLLDVQRF